MPKRTGAARDIQAKGRAKKWWKASSGKPFFFERAKRTLGGWSAAPIFAWIIIHNRELDRPWHWKGWIKKESRNGPLH